MKFEVNLSKKYFFILLGAILILAGAIYGYAQNPDVFGHSGEEIEVIIDGETKLLNEALAGLSGGSYWEEVDLDSTELFDTDCMYYWTTDDGYITDTPTVFITQFLTKEILWWQEGTYDSTGINYNSKRQIVGQYGGDTKAIYKSCPGVGGTGGGGFGGVCDESMKDGWPDAISCIRNDNSGWMHYIMSYEVGDLIYYRTPAGANSADLVFNENAESFNSESVSSDCDGKTIDELENMGRTNYFSCRGSSDADYDSGWVNLAGGNNKVILNHNLGTSFFKNVMIYGSCGSDTSKPILADGISSSGTGGYGYGLSFLTENSVTVDTYFHGGMYTHECLGIGDPPQGSTHFRLMIWE